MLVTVLIFTIGIIQAQDVNSGVYTSGVTTYSTGGDSLARETNIVSYAIDIRRALTLREDPNRSLSETDKRSAISYVLPDKLSFQFNGTLFGAGDSLILNKGIQFSADTTTWSDVVWLDTLNGVSANTSEWHVLSLSEFPDMDYFRISTTSGALVDSADTDDKYRLRYK